MNSMRNRLLGQAKQHYCMDAQMSEVVDPVSDEEVKSGVGTKVVITIGPASQSVEVLSAMLLAGVDVARLDLTWGSLEFHRTSLKNLATAMRATKRLCCVWVDTVGREILVRTPAAEDSNGWLVLEKTPIKFEAGQEVVITTDPEAQVSPSLLPVNVPSFPMLVKEGQILHVGRFLASGAEDHSLFLQVQSTTPNEIRCVAQNSASLTGLLTVLVSHREFELSTHKQDLNRELPLLTEHDVSCIQTFGSEFEIDYVSLSYCNSADDVWTARQTLDSLGLTQTKLVAKVERKAAIHNFEEIMCAADGILFSRGNLGLDFEPEEMAQLQKRSIARCNLAGKPIILTRFVDTMVNTPRPTRAEATDVANAVLDGVDGILLGAETVRGIYPVETVTTVVKLCRAAEHYFDYRSHHEDLMGEAFEEELSLTRVYSSAEDLSRRAMPTPPPLNPIKAANGDGWMANSAPAGASDNGVVMGSPGNFARNQGASKFSSFGTLQHVGMGSSDHLSRIKDSGAPYMSKVESIASSAVRTAEKINAGMIVVLAQTGRTVSLVAKYRPPMPVLAVVVPTLRSSNLGWQLEGKFLARQCLVLRGVRPMLAAPMTDSGEGLLAEAIDAAHGQGLIKPSSYVVCIMSDQGSLVVKVVQVNETGTGIAKQPLPSSFAHAPTDSRQSNIRHLQPSSSQSGKGYTFGLPSSPTLMRRASMSLAGAGALGAGNADIMGAVGIAPTMSDNDSVIAHFANALQKK